MREFAGKTAFITGGGSGIGLGMARAFLARGMNVVLADLLQQHLDEAGAELGHTNRVLALKLDVTDREAMARPSAARWRHSATFTCCATTSGSASAIRSTRRAMPTGTM